MMRKMLVLLLFALCCNINYAANIVWNTFQVDDFSTWIEGMWLLGAPLPYGPSVGILGDGSIHEPSCWCYGRGGAYWVHSFFGDELCSQYDYAERELLADVYYTGDTVIAGTGVSGREYLAILGWALMSKDGIVESVPYYGWVEIDADEKSVIASALTADGPLRVGTGELIPEPSSALLMVIGCAGLLLRRRAV